MDTMKNDMKLRLTFEITLKRLGYTFQNLLGGEAGCSPSDSAPFEVQRRRKKAHSDIVNQVSVQLRTSKAS